MKILIVGSGGRESALAWKIAQSKLVSNIYCAPGNPNTATYADNVEIESSDIEALLDFAKLNLIDITMVGPEIPLISGIVDLFEANGLNIIGPNKLAAQMEGSKVFCKQLLQKYNIPTAKYETFSDADEAKAYIRKVGAPLVVKADGAAAGKGVTVAFTVAEALEAVTAMMESKVFGDAGNKIVVEEMLLGPEASLLAFCDGETIVPMASCQDHKRVHDGDLGPNTGGMGVYSPVPLVSDELLAEVMKTILEPTVQALRHEGIVYKGILYAGLMLTADGPKVIEYNVRFGDPETQVILPRLETDLIEIFQAIISGKLKTLDLKWSDSYAVCVVMAAQGYPGDYAKGKVISGLDKFDNKEGTLVFHAGTAFKDGKVVTNGGRVLNVVSLAGSLRGAIDKVYSDINSLEYEGAFYRKDIAAKGLLQ